MNAQAPRGVEFLSCTIVEGNSRETNVNLPIHTTKRGRKWIAASPVKMEQHGTLYIYALFLDPKLIEPAADGSGDLRYGIKLRRGDAIPYFDLDEV
ncbi:hypothetical protein BH09VER1_BH09VER1_04790 [soil metagenome]